MRRMRALVAGGVIVGLLAMAGCAARPDLSGLEDELGQVDGVNGAIVWTTHPGAPWNTQVNVTLFLDEASSDAVIDAARAAGPVLAADPSASRHDVTIAFADAQRADYTRDSISSAPPVTVMPEVYEHLGLQDTGAHMILIRAGGLGPIADAG